MRRTTEIMILLFTTALIMPAWADERMLVPPSDEIMVITPQEDTLDRPAPRILERDDGTQVVEIPPVLVVHRYYYTGDRSFQGPMLPGGKSVIVVNHPRSGEQVMVEANLLPGAPRIHYSRKGIRYDYGSVCLMLDFGLLRDVPPKMVYLQEPSRVTAVRSRSKEALATVREAGAATGLQETAAELRQRSKDALVGLGERVSDVQRGLVDRVSGIVDATPLGSLFKPSAERPLPAETLKSGIVDELQNTRGLNL